jgi:hypothetical protein
MNSYLHILNYNTPHNLWNVVQNMFNASQKIYNVVDKTYSVLQKTIKNRKLIGIKATAYNEWFAKMAAVPTWTILWKLAR